MMHGWRAAGALVALALGVAGPRGGPGSRHTGRTTAGAAGIAHLRRRGVSQCGCREGHRLGADRAGPASGPRAPPPSSRPSIPTGRPAAMSRSAPPSTTGFGGPLVPLSVTLQGGIGYSKPDAMRLLPGQDVTELRFPVGMGFALTIPNPALWPSSLDRAPGRHRARPGRAPNTETNFGLSGGLELNLLNGFGLQAAYDRVFTDGGRSQRLRHRRALRLPGSRTVRPVAARRRLAARCCSASVAGCAETFDATTLGVPVTLASPAGQPPQGDRFRVTSHAVYGFWGLAKIKDRRCGRRWRPSSPAAAVSPISRSRCGAAGATC